MENNEIVVKDIKAITSFGERNEIKELGERLQKMMPGATRYTETEALTIAQIAIAHGLDPFNGEVWGIKSDEGRWYGVMVGIKGLRKAARRAAEAENSSFWINFILVSSEKYNAKDNDTVYECHLRDNSAYQAWIRSYSELKREAGLSKEEIENLLGPPPLIIGVGIASPNERSKMNLHARARKRAEADALKQRYSVEFMGANFKPDAEESEYIDGDVTEVKELDEPRNENEILTELGYEAKEEEPEPVAEPETEPKPEDKPKRPYPPEVVKAKLAEITAQIADTGKKPDETDRNMLAANLELCFAGEKNADKIRHSVLKYLFGKDSVKDIDDAQVLAAKRWLNASPDSGGQWMPDEFSVKEAQSIWAEALREAGQQEFEF